MDNITFPLLFVLQNHYISSKKTTNEKVRDIYWNRYKFQHCFYCKTRFIRYSEFQADHIVPRDRGGMDSFPFINHFINLVPACKACNSEKSNKLLASTEHLELNLIPFYESIIYYEDTASKKNDVILSDLSMIVKNFNNTLWSSPASLIDLQYKILLGIFQKVKIRNEDSYKPKKT